MKFYTKFFCKTRLLFYFFYCLSLHLNAQGSSRYFVSTGIDLAVGKNTYYNATTLGSFVQIGAEYKANTVGIRYSGFISTLQPSWQTMGDLNSLTPYYTVELIKTVPFPTFQPKLFNNLTKFESITLKWHRKRKSKAGFIDLQLGIGHFRHHQVTVSSPGFIMKGNTTYTNTIFDFKNTWKPYSAIGLGYVWKDMEFSCTYIPTIQVYSLGTTYKHYLGDYQSEKEEVTKALKFHLSLSFANFYGLSSGRNGAASAFQTEIALVNKRVIYGFMVSDCESIHNGVDLEKWPTQEYSRNYEFTQFHNMTMFSIYAGRIRQISNKESWFQALGLDYYGYNAKEREALGLMYRLGWHANAWTGSLSLHQPISTYKSLYLEYTVGLGLYMFKSRKY